ncbi:MAG TPA: hypothetical protein VLW75_06945 [Rhizomicrobium sp.]|nr:hypothetical protein [Rhizomicrobium sp.]
MAFEIKLTLVALGLFFLTALLTGVWKYRHMLTSPTHLAPQYVDVAHKAALNYSFAILIVMKFEEVSGLGTSLNLLCASLIIGFFAIATATYVRLGIANKTDNQFKVRNFSTTIGTWMLIAAEFGGFLVLFGGFLRSTFA